MKKTNKLLILSLGFLSVFSACQTDDEPEPSDDPRDRFVASWTCQETSTQTGTSPAFTVHINKSSSSSSQVLIENIYGLGFQNKATANATGNSLTIGSQVISGNTFTGEGTLQGSSTILLNYRVNDGSVIDTVSATLTKQ